MPKNIFKNALDTIKNDAQTSYSSQPADWFISALGSNTTSGIKVNEKTALSISAYYDAIEIVSNDCARLPFSVIQKDYQTGNITHQLNHDVRYLLRKKPNHYQDAFQFRKQMTAWLLGWGNSYGKVERNFAGTKILAVHPIAPWNITIEKAKNREFWYHISDEDFNEKVHMSDMIHLKQFVLDTDEFVGRSVVQEAHDRLGGHIATERFGERYFKNGTHTAGLLTTPKELGSNVNGPNKDKVSKRMRSNVRKEFSNQYSGDSNWFEPVVLDGEWNYQNLTIAAQDAMLIERMKVTVEDVARWFHLPTSKLKSDQNSAYNTREQDMQEYVDSGLQPRLSMWTSQLDDKLLTRAENRNNYETMFDTNQLLKGDMEAQGDFLSKMVRSGIMTPNQALRQLGMDTFGEDGDIHFKDMNTEALEDYMERLNFIRENGGENISNDKQQQLGVIIDNLENYLESVNGYERVNR